MSFASLPPYPKTVAIELSVPEEYLEDVERVEVALVVVARPAVVGDAPEVEAARLAEGDDRGVARPKRAW